MNVRGKRAIVTGASSGIGRATAIELASRGCHVVLSGRRADALSAVARLCAQHRVSAEVVPCDVSKDLDCEELIRTAIQRLGGVDILVNNAGFGVFGPAEQIRGEAYEAMMGTNYLGTVRCTKAVLSHMLERGSGSIVNVASITGIMGNSGMAGYGATKFAILGFSEALRDEVIDRGIRVSMICPGTTTTELMDENDMQMIPRASILIPPMSSESVAVAIRRAIERGSYRVILPWQAAIYMRFKELFPKTAHWMMRLTSRLLSRGDD